MRKKGFTLLEMIAVVLIMALLTLIVLPTVLNQIRSQRSNVSESALQLIYASNELYLEENLYEYPMLYGATYCISLEELVKDGKLKSPVQDMITGKEIPLNQVVKTTVNEYGDGEYELVEAKNCKSGIKDGTVVYYNPVRDYNCSKLEADINSNGNGTLSGIKTGCMKWYIFNDQSDSKDVTMILDHNTTQNVVWNSNGNNNSMGDIELELDKLVKESNWQVIPRLIKADEVAKISLNSNWNSSQNKNWFYLGSNNTTDSSKIEAYSWLYKNTEDGEAGYWTSTPVAGTTNQVWQVGSDGKLLSELTVASGNYGIRPVITVSKYSITTSLEKKI